MQVREPDSTTRQLRSSIKSIVAQLDVWEEDQLSLAARHTQANRQAGGFLEARQQVALARARESLGTQNLRDPPCSRCGSARHLTEECDVVSPLLEDRNYSPRTLQSSSADIHRGIVHRLYLKVCELYQVSYPDNSPSSFNQNLQVTEVTEIFPEAPVLIDFQVIAVSEAATDLWQLRSETPSKYETKEVNRTGDICRLYYSKSFPVNFVEFCDKVLATLEEFDERF